MNTTFPIMCIAKRIPKCYFSLFVASAKVFFITYYNYKIIRKYNRKKPFVLSKSSDVKNA